MIVGSAMQMPGLLLLLLGLLHWPIIGGNATIALVKIHVVYCGPCGYKSKYEALRQQLLANFKPGQIEVTGEATTQSTGWFEVIVAGKLVHSKKNGDGYVDSIPKRQKIIQAIQNFMK